MSRVDARGELSAATIQFAARMLKLLGHPVRLRIVEVLERHGELPVLEIVRQVGEAQSTVSQHLVRMRALGLLADRRAGTQVYYSIALPQIHKLLDCIRGCEPEEVQL